MVAQRPAGVTSVVGAAEDMMRMAVGALVPVLVFEDEVLGRGFALAEAQSYLSPIVGKKWRMWNRKIGLAEEAVERLQGTRIQEQVTGIPADISPYNDSSPLGKVLLIVCSEGRDSDSDSAYLTLWSPKQRLLSESFQDHLSHLSPSDAVELLERYFD